MFAVIFTATIKQLDEEYAEVAAHMQRMAQRQYGCLGFSSCTEGNKEIAISYWETEAQIKEWRNNSEHLIAQGKGRLKWYENYTVQVVEVVREYQG